MTPNNAEGSLAANGFTMPKELVLFPNGDHNSLPWIGGHAYLDAIDQFVRKHVKS